MAPAVDESVVTMSRAMLAASGFRQNGAATPQIQERATAPTGSEEENDVLGQPRFGELTTGWTGQDQTLHRPT
ncbi:hypothetical protein GCM10007857_74600 [Bradyrhizobium iriomotense]|uniref:Uncharacterized protein n=1 Tax=Bradyrhizobium iriomotense TaxID=441950 RepID=A0ABQ6BCT8_9BRAD|nr:hypothetical protein GCM10007857_74600 [Bradyrhizobium iriomotense]